MKYIQHNLFSTHKSLENFNHTLQKLNPYLVKNQYQNTVYNAISQSTKQLYKTVDQKIEMLYKKTINNNENTVLPFISEYDEKRQIGKNLKRLLSVDNLREKSKVQDSQEKNNCESTQQKQNNFDNAMSIKKTNLYRSQQKLKPAIVFKRIKSGQKKKRQSKTATKQEKHRKKIDDKPISQQKLELFKFQDHELLKKFQRYNIFVRDYKITNQTTEFLNFQRAYYQDWDRINRLLTKIERFCIQYDIAQTKLDQRKLIEMAQRQAITPFDYLNMFQDAEELASKSKFLELKFFGKKGRNAAAIKIQKNIKMFLCKKKYKKMQDIIKRIKLIQGWWRRLKILQQTKIKFRQNWQLIYQNHKEKQKRFKKGWQNISVAKRVEIHIAGNSQDLMKRLTVQKFLQTENSQITRIFRLKDPNISIIYVCPYAMAPQILSYYKKVLQLSSTEESESRLVFVWPEVIFEDQSVTHNLLYSPKCLKRIKSYINNKSAYIVPGFLDNNYIKLAHYLDVPLYAGQIQKSLYLSTKSGGKSLTRQADQLLPYQRDIYNKEDLTRGLAQLIYTYPEIERWYLKIDDEKNARGNAYVQSNSIIQAEQLRVLVAQKNEDNKEDAIQILERIIQSRLQSKLRIVYRNLFQTVEEYLRSYLIKGGIIEGCVTILDSKVTNSNYFIDLFPNGEFKIETTYSKLIVNQRPVAAEFPADTKIEYDQIESIVKILYREGVFGYINVSFLHCKDKFYFNGVDCYMTNMSSSYYKAKALIDQQANTKFLYCPLIIHDGLSEMQIKSFFHLCRLENISFDIKRKIGSVFVFIDTLQSGTIGLLSICDNKYGLYKYMLNALEFLEKKLEKRKYQSIDAARTDKTGFDQIKNRISVVVKKYQKSISVKKLPLCIV